MPRVYRFRTLFWTLPTDGGLAGGGGSVSNQSAIPRTAILTVTLPKAEEAKPKQIDVQVN